MKIVFENRIAFHCFDDDLKSKMSSSWALSVLTLEKWTRISDYDRYSISVGDVKHCFIPLVNNPLLRTNEFTFELRAVSGVSFEVNFIEQLTYLCSIGTVFIKTYIWHEKSFYFIWLPINLGIVTSLFKLAFP